MTSRCVLLFTRSPKAEARTKRLPGAEPLFALAAERVADAALSSGFDLLVVGGADAVRPHAGRLSQRGRDLGERLANAFADARARGYDAIVAVPGDVPGLDPAHFAAAAAALEAGHLVLGPSPDGGVYLLGLPPGAGASLLEGVRWQTGAVFRDLLLRARHRPVQVLPPLRDLDRPRDLAPLARASGDDPLLVALVRHIRSRPLLGGGSEAPHAPRLLRSLVEPLRGPPASA